jgi:hypothetical protein
MMNTIQGGFQCFKHYLWRHNIWDILYIEKTQPYKWINVRNNLIKFCKKKCNCSDDIQVQTLLMTMFKVVLGRKFFCENTWTTTSMHALDDQCLKCIRYFGLVSWICKKLSVELNFMLVWFSQWTCNEVGRVDARVRETSEFNQLKSSQLLPVFSGFFSCKNLLPLIWTRQYPIFSSSAGLIFFFSVMTTGQELGHW